MATTVSIEGFTDMNVRGNVLPRVFHARSLTTRMVLRLRRAKQLLLQARNAPSDDQIFVWVAALSVAWTLVENTLKLYDTIAEQIDTRSEGKRRSLDSRFLRERSDEEKVDFHKKVWMFAIFDEIPDSALVDIGIDPDVARRLVRDMIERSIRYLTTSEEQMSSFYRKYKDVMNAHKHGRALFAFLPEFHIDTADDNKRFSLNATRAAVTAFIPQNATTFDTPTRLLTLTADDELVADVERVFDLLAAQLPKFQEFFAAMANAVLQFLAYLEHSSKAERPVVPFSFFAEPYSREEQDLLDTIRSRSLRV